MRPDANADVNANADAKLSKTICPPPLKGVDIITVLSYPNNMPFKHIYLKHLKHIFMHHILSLSRQTSSTVKKANPVGLIDVGMFQTIANKLLKQITQGI